jgi:diguanylate cyclase (GGDEF)-like protein
MFGRVWQSRCMQWAPPQSSTVPRAVDRLVRLRPAQAWLLVLGCTDAAAFGDLLTGPDLWFGPVYLVVICTAAWSLGWRPGQLTGVGCMVLTFAINGANLYPYTGGDFAWNLGMRFVAVSLIIAVIAGVRRAYVREWWLARTDNLTGALNRQAFFELASSTIDPHSWRLLVYADLDGLKKVNDVQGHAAGDACLKAYGAAVRKMIRRNDIFARVGGDEFLIFMSVKDEGAARAVASRLHKAVNLVSAGRSSLKCSVGGLVVPPGDASMDDLVRSADNLMYEAKLRGACLQMGIASHVERPALGRARGRLRGSVWALAGKRRSHDRRAESPQSFAGESLPR